MLGLTIAVRLPATMGSRTGDICGRLPAIAGLGIIVFTFNMNIISNSFDTYISNYKCYLIRLIMTIYGSHFELFITVIILVQEYIWSSYSKS